MRCPKDVCRSGWSWDSTTRTRCSIRTWPSSASSSTRSSADLLRGGQMVRYGAKALPEGGWHTIPRPYMDGGSHCRRRGRLPELVPPEGHPSGDAHGHAGRRNRVRRGTCGGHVGDAALRVSAPDRRRPVRAELYRCATCTRLRVRPVRGAPVFGVDAGLQGRWSATIEGHPGHDRMRTLVPSTTVIAHLPTEPSSAMQPDRVLTFDKVTNVHFSGTRHDEDQPPHLLVHTEVCRHDLRGGVRAPVHAVLPGATSTRSSRTPAAAAPADQRLQLRALQDVRHHGPLSGDHVGAARRRRRPAVRRAVTRPSSGGARRAASGSRPS